MGTNRPSPNGGNSYHEFAMHAIPHYLEPRVNVNIKFG